MLGAMAKTPAPVPPAMRQVNVRRFGRPICDAQSSACTVPTLPALTSLIAKLWSGRITGAIPLT